MPLRLVLFLSLWLGVLNVQAQMPSEILQDSISEHKKKGIFNHDSIPWPNPKIAFKLSAILPGAGQIYNKGYWKPPIIYAGFGVFTYLILNHHAQFKLYRSSYIAKTDTTSPFRTDPYPQFNVNAVQLQRNFHRQSRDMMFLLGAVWYALNIVEAFVDAHMKHFDVSEEISMRVTPAPLFYQSQGTAHFGPGLRVGFRF
jgi:hypothetical protein